MDSFVEAGKGIHSAYIYTHSHTKQQPKVLVIKWTSSNILDLVCILYPMSEDLNNTKKYMTIIRRVCF